MSDKENTVSIVDPRKVNLSEKDIEDWLEDNPEALGIGVEYWLSRQYKLPSGILDLLGYISDENVVVVEIKNTEITSESLAQVCRYAHDIDRSIFKNDSIPYMEVTKVVVGKSIPDSKIQYEANALEVKIITFNVTLDLDFLGPWNWAEKRREELEKEYDRIGHDEIFMFIHDDPEGEIEDIIQEAREAAIGGKEDE